MLDIDDVLNLPMWKINEWLAYFRIKEERAEEQKERAEKHEKAREAAKNGGFN